MDYVYKKLFVGNSQDAKDIEGLTKNSITCIVNVAFDLNDPWYSNIKTYKVGFLDGPGNSLKEYIRISRFVYQLLLDNETVLIHCHEGKSRAASIALIVISTVMLLQDKKDLTIIDALEQTKIILFNNRPLCANIKQVHFDFIEKTIQNLIESL